MKTRVFLGLSKARGAGHRSFESWMERRRIFLGLEFLLEILHVDEESEECLTPGGQVAFYRLAEFAIKREEEDGVIVRHAITSWEVEAAVNDHRIPLEQERDVHDARMTSGERAMANETVPDPQEAEIVLRKFWMFLRVLRLTCRIIH